MKFSVCIETFFNNKKYKKLSLAEKIKIVKEAGFNYIEFWGWRDKDLDELEEALNKYNIKIATFCTDFISLIPDEKSEEYTKALLETINVAKRFNVRKIITQVGNFIEGVKKEDQYNQLVKNLKGLDPYLKENEMILMIEPLNTLVDHKGYFLSSSIEAKSILEEVGSDNIKMLFDIYHQQITEGNIIRNIKNCEKYISHFHIGDNPGRNEPGTGEINYTNIFEFIKNEFNDITLGLEFYPSKDVIEILGDGIYK